MELSGNNKDAAEDGVKHEKDLELEQSDAGDESTNGSSKLRTKNSPIPKGLRPAPCTTTDVIRSFVCHWMKLARCADGCVDLGGHANFIGTYAGNIFKKACMEMVETDLYKNSSMTLARDVKQADLCENDGAILQSLIESKVFNDYQLDWITLAMPILLVADLCVRMALEDCAELQSKATQIIDCLIGMYKDNFWDAWIQKHGGWESFSPAMALGCKASKLENSITRHHMKVHSYFLPPVLS